jgi:hypothetical protein
MPHIVGKFSMKAKKNFRPHFNQRSSHKVMGSKVVGVPILGISGLQFGSPEAK